MSVLPKVDEILKKANIPDRHTFFQIEKFIIGKEPTAQAQLWAIARELQARKETIDNFDKELKDVEDNLELMDLKIERIDRTIKKEASSNSEDTDLNIKECEINIRKLQREKSCLIQSACKVKKKYDGILEEINYLVSGYEKITSQYEEMKKIDDEQAQKEMWNEKLLEEFNLRVIFNRPFDTDFIKTVMCLNDDAPVKKHVIALIENIQKRMIAVNTNTKPPEIEVKPKTIAGK
jgi:hypothetical protein